LEERSPRLRLVVATAASIRTEIEDPSRLAGMIGAAVPADWPPETLRHALPQFLKWHEEHPDWAGWLAWYAIRLDMAAPVLCGSVGFKGPPDRGGMVEIGCGVLPAHQDGWDPTEREPVTLIIEWPDGEAAPTKYYLTTLPRTWPKKRLIRFLKERWRTERVYEDLKGELGLDHFEGRTYPGWHHHISVALCCFSFLAAERARAFPPSARRPPRDDTQPGPT